MAGDPTAYQRPPAEILALAEAAEAEKLEISQNATAATCRTQWDDLIYKLNMGEYGPDESTTLPELVDDLLALWKKAQGLTFVKARMQRGFGDIARHLNNAQYAAQMQQQGMTDSQIQAIIAIGS